MLSETDSKRSSEGAVVLKETSTKQIERLEAEIDRLRTQAELKWLWVMENLRVEHQDHLERE